MVCRIRTSTITGISAVSVDVEVEAKDGKANFTIIGMGDVAIRESRDRVQSALRHSGFRFTPRILVNLAPAELKKEGSSFDLAMAIGILISSGQIKSADLNSRAFHGELSLDGRLKPVRGVIALTIEARRWGAKEILVPYQNWAEAALISGIEVVGLRSLTELIAYLQGDFKPAKPANGLCQEAGAAPQACLSEVKGQTAAKRALLIAAAGRHNLLMIGPPGCGKSMLAERFGSLLPAMSEEETLEVVRIHSVAGLPIHGFLSGQRSYRSPHHVISEVGLIGGGAIPRPGEISLAHHGVLFLDEFPEYSRAAIEALRAPLERGVVNITRAKASMSFPARFQLLAAMNPCPCGRLGAKGLNCLCSRSAIHGYLQRISQPILDRIDLQVELEAVSIAEVAKGPTPADHDQDQNMRELVQKAHALALERAGKVNAALENKEILKVTRLSTTASRLIEQASQKGVISARSYFRILKIARTIADLAGSQEVSHDHLAEAINFRGLDRIEKYCC